ncbi:hypothetical protein P8625_11195 [Tenacibaculum tangerinum]|uniref:Uncharacterized protein n=1 Tax=Tenacibaculum tangerinum TaxID=3038772 RepID=A0ABY8KZZ6_9FLAO|nr:hypothetical protein [Tenacibaculum tangerinum]WGH74650.1 hypothetical protein P8625_11195 [Tenacibaculum tangerinum]
MSEVLISNVSFYDKDYFNEFLKNNNKHFSIGSPADFWVSFYKDLLREVINDEVDESFRDRELGNKQIKQIQKVFERELENKLPDIESIPEAGGPINEVIEWKGQEYRLCLSLTKPISRQVSDFYKIISICKECLLESKPMYLSIE